MSFLNTIIFGVPSWKWLGLISAGISLYFIRIFISWLIIKIKRTQNSFLKKTFMQFFLKQEIEKILGWILVSIVALIIIDLLELPISFVKYSELTIKLFLSINVIRTCYFAAAAFGLSIQDWAKTNNNGLNDQLAPLATRTLKVTVVIVGSLIVLQNFGVNVTALLAGLGIGGVALAFAAQDTVANVFGTITILLDAPFKLGDHIKIGDTEGFVEEIGFRSTQIRTLYNSLVILPNSVVAKEKVDNLTRRNNWIRFRRVLGFTYDANPQLINAFAENLKYQLLQEPSVDRTRIAIHFNEFGDSSLNVIVSFHFKLNEDEDEPAKINRYLNLIYDVAQEQKLSFAYPTRTLILQNKVN